MDTRLKMMILVDAAYIAGLLNGIMLLTKWAVAACLIATVMMGCVGWYAAKNRKVV